MRVLTLAVLLTAGCIAFCQTPEHPSDKASSPEQKTPATDSNVVVLKTATPWWESSEFNRRISLVIHDVDLNGAIDALGKAANISLVASGGTRAQKKVSLNLRNAPLRDVMLALANLYGLAWYRTGDVYTLTAVTATQKRLGPPPAQFKQPTLKPMSFPSYPRRRRIRVSTPRPTVSRGYLP